MTVDPRAFIGNIDRDGDGVWRPDVRSAVSYPDEGHDACHGVEGGSFWFAHRNRCIEALLRRFPPSSPFVDVGGGNGFVAEMVQRLGHDVILVEPGATGIGHARDRGIKALVHASLEDLDVRPGSFGAIGLFDVVEHIQDDLGALETMRRMLAADGRVFATVPAHQWLWSSVDVDAGHFRRYTAANLRRLFVAAGFDVDFCSYYFWPLPAPMFALRSLPERLGKRPARRERRVQSEHRGGHWIDTLLAWECERFGQGLAVPVGASCLLVATRH